VTFLYPDWAEYNQKFLVACIDEIKMLLKNHVAKLNGKPIEDVKPMTFPEGDGKRPSAIENLCTLFALSSFERSVLVLCAGVELDVEVAKLCVDAQRDQNCVYPTFGLALKVLPHPHWSAVTPISPLRYFRLIELCDSPPMPVIARPLALEERVLHYLTGISYLEPQLQAMIKPIRDQEFLYSLYPKLFDPQHPLVQRILTIWRKTVLFPCVQLVGTEENMKLAIALSVSREVDCNLWFLPIELFPKKTDEFNSLCGLLNREMILMNAILYVSAENVDRETQKLAAWFMEITNAPLFVGTSQCWYNLPEPGRKTSIVSLESAEDEKRVQTE
jgi:hypothetical protein